MDETRNEKKTKLYAVSIETVDEDLRLCLRVPLGAAWNLAGFDAFIGELISWRDRYAKLVEKDEGE